MTNLLLATELAIVGWYIAVITMWGLQKSKLDYVEHTSFCLTLQDITTENDSLNQKCAFKVLYLWLSVYHSHNLNQTKQRIVGQRQIWRWEKISGEKQRDTPDKTDNTAYYEGSNIPEVNLNLREIKLLSNLCWTQCCQHICILTVTHLACSLTLPARCGSAYHRLTVTQEEETVRVSISMSMTFTDFNYCHRHAQH